MCNTDESQQPRRGSARGCKSARRNNKDIESLGMRAATSCEDCKILQKFDDATLMEVLLRLRLSDICRSAASCKVFARIARSEWLWQQLCARSGVEATEGGQSQGWRALYTSLRQVRAINWSPQPMAELSRLAEVLRGIGIPAGHAMMCINLDIAASSSDPYSFTATHPTPFTFDGNLTNTRSAAFVRSAL